MAMFPVLKTGAVAQYPLGFGIRYRTQAVHFLDGRRQMYPLMGTGLRRWTINLNLLDEQELGAVTAFVEQQGTAEFTFTDPLTGTDVPKCVLSGQRFEAMLQRDMTGKTTVDIEEIP